VEPESNHRRTIVFICTGNTCRSPLAEVMCRQLIAERGISGVEVRSAGIAAYAGDLPSPLAVAVATEMGIDLSQHRSQRVTPEVLQDCEFLVTMTRAHQVMLEMALPAEYPRPELLCGDEGDLDDPIGMELDVYHECARTIRRHLERLLTEWRLA